MSDSCVKVMASSASYDIVWGAGSLARAEHYGPCAMASSLVLVSNEAVMALWGDRVRGALKQASPAVLHEVIIPEGEAHKTWETLNLIHTRMLELGCDRRCVVLALGGGVVGDLTGFAASTYMRGVAFMQLPTTLLAQVDSSVGGKTAINHPLGKNMIGTFAQPAKVIIDLNTLGTLPARELRAGLAEVIKYGFVLDAEFLVWLEDHMEALLALDMMALGQAVRRSCEIKAQVVGQDEREAGRRAILNFGHTFGHAIEAGLGFGAWLHGEAVAAGMVMAAQLSVELGGLEPDDVQRLTRLLARAGLPMHGPDLGVGRYMALMHHDKKAEGGALRFVVLEGLGRGVLRSAPDDAVHRAIQAWVAAHEPRRAKPGPQAELLAAHSRPVA